MMERRGNRVLLSIHTQSVTHLEKFFRIRASGFKRDLHSFTSSPPPSPLVIGQTITVPVSCTPSNTLVCKFFFRVQFFRQTGRKRIILATVTTISLIIILCGCHYPDIRIFFDNYVFSAQQ